MGAAVTYYALPKLPEPFRTRCILALPVFLIALVSLSRVLACCPGLCRPPSPAADAKAPFSPYFYHIIHRRIIALSGGLILGIAAGVSYLGDAPRLGLPTETIRGISGVMGEDPRESRNGRGMGYLDLRSVAGADSLRATARGRVLVFFPAEALPRLRDFGRSAEVFVEGDFAGDTGGKSSGGFTDGPPLFRAQGVHVVKSAPAWEKLRTGVRLAILDKLEGHVWGGLGAALLLGVKDNLDSALAQKYQAAGCSHVLALSGMHLAIVAALVAFFLRKFLGLKAASIAGAVLILLYVALIGVQSSLERAAIMYLLGTGVAIGFLPRRPLSLLAMAFLIQIAIRPSSGTGISFILSYLALAGILTLGEFFHSILRGWIPEFLARPLSASLGAYLATAAVVAANFGMARPVGLLAGLVVVPLTTVFMVGVLAALALSFIAPVLVNILGMGLTLLYSLLDYTVSLAGMVPGITVNGWGWELCLSLLCLFLGRPYTIRRQALAPFT
ncbi:hypothetical protein AGMMS4952_00780 [Spirochaetia bacterium]|nr:hypothetical protein AGMMS4952_00780 [Spirochaetia bacterium]